MMVSRFDTKYSVTIGPRAASVKSRGTEHNLYAAVFIKFSLRVYGLRSGIYIAPIVTYDAPLHPHLHQVFKYIIVFFVGQIV